MTTVLSKELALVVFEDSTNRPVEVLTMSEVMRAREELLEENDQEELIVEDE